MALSAAELQKRHQLEGAPDPFPSLTESPSMVPKSTRTGVDTDSQSAFPSLVSSTPASGTAPKPVWGSATGPRIKPTVLRTPVFADSFTLTAIDLSSTGRDGKPATLGEVMKQVMAKYKVKLEASGNQKTRQTTFHIKADTQKELEKAKRSLLALLSPVITLTVQAPAATIPSIIGLKGSNLKQIRDQTGVRIDIPPRGSLAAPNGNGHTVSSPLEDDEEITVPVTLTGPQPLAYEAQALVKQIISSKTSKSVQRVKDIPAHIFPFVLAKKHVFLTAAEGSEILLTHNDATREFIANGDREAVVRVIETIREAVNTLTNDIVPVKMSFPKRQHRLLTGRALDDIMAKSNCTATTPGDDDPSEEVTVWGQSGDLPAGLTAAMACANSQYIHEFFLPKPIATSKQILTYMTHAHYARTLHNAHPDVSMFLPSSSAVEKAQTLKVDLVGPKTAVDAAVSQISELIGKLTGATKLVTIDWLVHRIIISKNAKKLKQLYDVNNILVIFPNESEEQSTVVLVYDPLSSSASVSLDDKKNSLDEVEKELLKLAKDAADVKSEKVAVETRWHDAVVGLSGTTLNVLIGEDKTLSIKVGAEAGDPSTQDVILVRGASSDVDRAVKEILKIVENAKNDEIVNSYSTEFDIDKEYVGRVVGAHGAGINKLRDQLGVKVDVSDDTDDKEKEGSKKKKATHQKSKVKITGRQENVEEAKKRVLNQVERLADETSEILKIPNQFHSALIGQSGKYAIRLEERYSVKITFPRQSAENGEGKTREQLRPDEVLIKGGKKGVANAKQELIDAAEFEKESNNTLKFTVPNRAIARILGKGGASINEIKDETDTQIDIQRTDDGGSTTNITVRGTKKAINAAKVAILAIADQVAEEITVTVPVESRFHRNLIGPGGQGLKDLVARCGGPSDTKLQAGLIRFPRQGEPSDEVKLRGEPKLVNTLKTELEKVVAILRDHVVLGIEIPASQHRTFIGRGGQNLNDLQSKRDVQIQFPGSRSYHQVGDVENITDLAGVDPANLVKVSGTRTACEETIGELKRHIKPPAPEGITETISVPFKYHHAISQQGNFFRTLRSFGVQVDQSHQPSKSAVPSKPPSTGTLSARIDEAEDESALKVGWQVIPNYQDAEEGDSVWTLKARDQPDLERAKTLIQEAINHAEQMSHVGFLTLPDRSVFPRIVGSKGATVARLRTETGADITVSREDSTIVIIGSETAILAAKDAITKVASSPGRNQRQQWD